MPSARNNLPIYAKQSARHCRTAAGVFMTFAAPFALAHLPITGAAAAAGCNGNSKALGVSRVLEIDTRGGSLYGRLQYKNQEPLGDKEVVLTFDDGPLRPHTRKVLAALAAHCTKATFFMVGRMAVADPAMVREVGAAGHTIAGHTWSHRNLANYSKASAAGEIELGISAVAHALGRPMAPFFRFPYLSDPKAMINYLGSRDIATFSIDVDSNDYRTQSGDWIRRTIMRQLADRGRGIILMHDIQRSTANGIRALLNDLAAKGYKVVHLKAKTPLKSRPDYDAHAAELHKKRRTIARAHPLPAPGAKWHAPPEKASRGKAANSKPAARERRDDKNQTKKRVARGPAARTPQPKPGPADRGGWRNRALGLD